MYFLCDPRVLEDKDYPDREEGFPCLASSTKRFQCSGYSQSVAARIAETVRCRQLQGLRHFKEVTYNTFSSGKKVSFGDRMTTRRNNFSAVNYCRSASGPGTFVERQVKPRITIICG